MRRARLQRRRETQVGTRHFKTIDSFVIELCSLRRVKRRSNPERGETPDCFAEPVIGTRARIAATQCARAVHRCVPRENRGRRESRALAAPAASRAVKGSTRVSHHRFNRNIRPSPRNGVNGLLRALPGVRDFLVTVACRRLSTSQGAPGPHAFAVRCQHHSSNLTWARVHRIPPRVRDDAYAPPVEARRREENMSF